LTRADTEVVFTAVGEGVDGTEVSSVSEAPLLLALSVATDEMQEDVDEEVTRVEGVGRPVGVVVVVFGWHLNT
jgi:hypothetical protein